MGGYFKITHCTWKSAKTFTEAIPPPPQCSRGDIQGVKLKQKRTGFLRNLDKNCALIGQFIETSLENLFFMSSISSLNIASGKFRDQFRDFKKVLISMKIPSNCPIYKLTLHKITNATLLFGKCGWLFFLLGQTLNWVVPRVFNGDLDFFYLHEKPL